MVSKVNAARREVSEIEEIRMSDRTRRLMEEHDMTFVSFCEAKDDAGKDPDPADVGDGQCQGFGRGTSILHWSLHDDDDWWIDWDDSHDNAI